MSEEQTQKAPEEVIVDVETGEIPAEKEVVEETASIEGGNVSDKDSEPTGDGEPKSYSLDDLSDNQEEAAEQLAQMSEEDQQKYLDLLAGKEPEKPDVGENPNEDKPLEENITPLMGIDAEIYKALSPEKRKEIENINIKLDEMDKIDVNNFRAGLAKFESDPLIKMRMDQLQGKGQVLDDASIKHSMSPETIRSLGLDFELHPEKSLNILSNHLQNTVSNAISSVVNTYETGNKQREGKAKLDKELDFVRDSYEGMKSELQYSDPNHPMKDFMAWLGKNRRGIDIRTIGGGVAYEAYLKATGKSKGLVVNAVAKGQQDILDKLKRADKKVATLPRRSNVSKPTTVNGQGINVKRLQSDMAYADSLFEKFEDNPKMIAAIERLAIS